MDHSAKDKLQELHKRCYQGKHEEVNEILRNSPALANIPGQFDFTCVHHAAWGGSIEVIDVLLRYKIDLKALTDREDTAVLIATNYGHEEFVEKVTLQMVEDGNLQFVNRPSKLKQTALLRAAQDGRVNLVRFFCALGITLTDYKDCTEYYLYNCRYILILFSSRRTALDYAEQLDFPECTKILQTFQSQK